MGKRWPGENCPLRREFWIHAWHVRLVVATGGRLIKLPRFPGLSTNTNVTFYCNCFTISTPPSDCLLASTPLKFHIAPPWGGTAYFENHDSIVSDCIFEIHQLWQSGFSRVYSNFCCSCSFEPEIIKNWSVKIYSNNIVNFQESTIILNAHTKKSGNLSYEPRISHHLSLCNLKCCLYVAEITAFVYLRQLSMYNSHHCLCATHNTVYVELTFLLI